MRYMYVEQRHPMRPHETRLLVTWPGHGWWNVLGEIVSRPADEYGPEHHEVWPAYRLDTKVSKIMDTHEACVEYLKKLWEDRRRR